MSALGRCQWNLAAPWPINDIGLAGSQLCRLFLVNATVGYMFSDFSLILVMHSNVIRPSLMALAISETGSGSAPQLPFER